MTSDYQLHAGQQRVVALPAGAEIFCAQGCLAVCATPSVLAGEMASLKRELAAGQGWRADARMAFILEARTGSRYRIELPAAQAASEPAGSAHEKSLLLWGRRLLGAA